MAALGQMRARGVEGCTALSVRGMKHERDVVDPESPLGGQDGDATHDSDADAYGADAEDMVLSLPARGTKRPRLGSGMDE